MRKLVLTLPALFLALNADVLLPRSRALPAPRTVDLEAALAELPGRNVGRFGRTGDALNMVFVGAPEEVASSLNAAGWTRLPPTIAASVAEGFEDLFSGRPLTRFPPMNDYRLMGRCQDMNWVRVITPLQTRHHFRLWRTGLLDARGREFWWGSGDFDLSIRWRDLSHRPHPDLNLERDFLAESLKGVAAVERLSWRELAQIPQSGFNDKGYPFSSDGRALVVELDGGR
jgi:hypothetical protein